jgi:carboxymethylenebutenolidase
MWNTFRTDAPLGGIVAGVSMMKGDNGDDIHTYIARPDGDGPYPGVVMTHHAPGWDEFYREFARRFAEHGYIAVVPNLFERFGQGTPDDVAAAARGAGGVSDASVIGDSQAALELIKALPISNGKVGVIGTCSGGRHALLVASKVPGFGAIADLWGASVVVTPDRLTPNQPQAVIDMTPDLNVPLIGLFGNDDMNPSPAQVDQHEQALKDNGKSFVFHRYDGAGHGFFYYHMPSYRQQQAMDGWNKVDDFFRQSLT